MYMKFEWFILGRREHVLWLDMISRWEGLQLRRIGLGSSTQKEGNWQSRWSEMQDTRIRCLRWRGRSSAAETPDCRTCQKQAHSRRECLWSIRQRTAARLPPRQPAAAAAGADELRWPWPWPVAAIEMLLYVCMYVRASWGYVHVYIYIYIENYYMAP